jgi:hypothetical protein
VAAIYPMPHKRRRGLSSCCTACGACVVIDEGKGGGGLFELGEVSGLLDDLKAGVSERGGVGRAVCGRDDAIALAPDDEGGDPDASEAAQERGVVHVRVTGHNAHRGHVGLLARRLLGRQRRRVDVETVGVVEGILRQAAGIKGEDIADGFTVDRDANRVNQDEAGDEAPIQPPMEDPTTRTSWRLWSSR